MSRFSRAQVASCLEEANEMVMTLNTRKDENHQDGVTVQEANCDLTEAVEQIEALVEVLKANG